MKKGKFLIFGILIMILGLVLIGCDNGSTDIEAKSYSATAEGFEGPVTVSLFIKDNKLVDVKIEGPHETQGVGSVAIERLPGRMLAANSVEVDGITGATYTSNAILAAAKAALEESGVTLGKVTTPGGEGEPRVYTTDVVVVGGGLAGLSAANSALQNDVRVVVLEKLPTTGGNAKSSLGSFMVAEVDENRQFQVSDELDTLTDALARWKQYQDTYSYRKNARYPDYNRLSYMLIETMFTVDWLKTLGATFEPKTPISDRGMAMLQVNVPEIPLTSGAAQLLAHLENLVTNNSNATLLVETAAYELIMDGNKAIGVKAKAPNGEIEVYGKSVILACGSYTQNQAMMEQYIPDIGEVDVWAVVSDTGDGIKMALEAGAALWEEDFIHPAPPNISNAFKAINPSRNNVPSFYNTLLVDKNGNRIMNEADSSYARQVLKMAELKTGPYWALHEDQDLTSAQREMLETGLSTTGVVKGETLAIVAEKAGISIGGFQTTFDQYNEFAATGNDTEFGKPAANLRPYGLEGPYYMVRMIPCACDVLGGIVTDQEYKILNDQGKPFDSLWAAGSMSNGQYYNQYYFSGSSLTFASTSGRLTGKQAADNAKK